MVTWDLIPVLIKMGCIIFPKCYNPYLQGQEEPFSFRDDLDNLESPVFFFPGIRLHKPEHDEDILRSGFNRLF